MGDQYSTQAPGRPRKITLESALFILVLLVGALVRVLSLFQGPLSGAESGIAIAALDPFAGRGYTSDGPGTVLATALSFLLFGDSDPAARLPAAIAGIGAMVSLWLFRPRLGRWAILFSAALMATSPVLSYVPTRSGGTAFAVLLLLLSGWWLSRLLGGETQAGAPVWLSILSLPMLLAFGPMGVAGSLTLLTYLALHILVLGKERAFGWIKTDTKDKARKYLVASLGLLLFIGLVDFDRAEGFRIPGLTSFTALFKIPEEGYSPLVSWAKLLAYEPALVLLSVVGVAFLLRQHRGRGVVVSACGSLRLFLISWAGVAAFVLTLAGPGHPETLAFFIVPLSLCAGLLLEAAIARVYTEGWQQAPYRLALIATAALWLLVSLATLAGEPLKAAGVPPWLGVAGSSALLVAALVWRSSGQRPQWSNLALGAFVVGVILNLHATEMLNSDTTAEWLAQSRPSAFAISFVGDLVRERTDKSSAKGPTVAVEPTLRYPFEWYLRSASSVKLSRDGDAAVVLSSGGIGRERETTLDGRGLVYMTRWEPSALDGRGLLRWFLYRDPFDGEIDYSTLLVQSNGPSR